MDDKLIFYLVEAPNALESKRLVNTVNENEVNNKLGKIVVFLNYEIAVLKNEIGNLTKKIETSVYSDNSYHEIDIDKRTLLLYKLAEKESLRGLIKAKSQLLTGKVIVEGQTMDYKIDNYSVERDGFLSSIIKARSGIYKYKEWIKSWSKANNIKDIDALWYKKFDISMCENKRDSFNIRSGSKLEEAKDIFNRIDEMSKKGISFLPKTEVEREMLALKLLIPGYINDLLVAKQSVVRQNERRKVK